jgi:hypothetical protein
LKWSDTGARLSVDIAVALIMGEDEVRYPAWDSRVVGCGRSVVFAL